MAKLIGQIFVSPSSPRPAEPVRVEVTGCDAGSTDAAPARVTINGVAGAVQSLQFPSEGIRKLRVVATAADGSTEEESVEVFVKGAPLQFMAANGHPDIAMLGVTQSA